MSWLKGAHIAALTVWCACLFYLPAVLAEAVKARDHAETRRAHIVARVVFVMVASPAAVLAIFTGTILVFAAGVDGLWLVAKLTVVAAMVFFHLQCGRLVAGVQHLARDRRAGSVQALVVFPVVLIPTVLWLVMGKPF